MDETNIGVITLGEIPVLKKTYTCEYCGKVLTTRKGWKKHIQKFHPDAGQQQDKDIIDTFDVETGSVVGDFTGEIMHTEPSKEQRELEKLRKELESIIMNNPSIDIESPVNTTLLQKIQSMSIEELKARIFNAKRALNSKLDLKISDGALSLVNQVIGRMLGCVKELEDAVMNDHLLRESTKDLLSFNLLAKIPSQLKVAGLYSIDLGLALNTAKKNKSMQIVTETITDSDVRPTQ